MTVIALAGVLLGGMSAAQALEPGVLLPGVTAGARTVIDQKAKSVVGPSLAVDGRGALHLAWMEEGKADGKEIRTVQYARSERFGAAPGPAIRVNRPEEAPYWRQEAPAIAVAPPAEGGQEVFVTWALTHPKAGPDKPFSAELRLSRSGDGGRTFDPSVQVNDDQEIIVHSFDSLHLGRDGVLHIAWIDGREGKKDPATFVAHSTDRGRTVARNLKIGDGTCVCCRTSLATGPDGTLYAAWRKIMEDGARETVVARSADGGATFTKPVVVGHDKWIYMGCPHRPASIGVDGQGRLYVVWYTEGSDETPAVYLAHSDDRGETFSPKRPLNLSKGTFPDHPQMAVDAQGRLVAVWEEQSPVRREIVMSVSLDRGQTLSRPMKLNDKKGMSPAVALNDQGQVAVSWMEHVMLGHRTVLQTFEFSPVQVSGIESRSSGDKP